MTLTIDKIIIKDKVKCEQKAKLYIKFINHFLKLNEKLTKKEYEQKIEEISSLIKIEHEKIL